MGQRNQVHLQKLKSGDAVPRSTLLKGGQKLPRSMRQEMEALGPSPKASLETFADLGLSDRDMARYFNVPEAHIAKLRSIWGVR